MTQFNTQKKAVFFIDGSNWYHTAKKIGVRISRINYPALADKLSESHREVVNIRYYVGRVSENLIRARNQEKFLSTLKAQGVEVILGRVERKRGLLKNNPVQQKLQQFLSSYEGCEGCVTNSEALDVLKKLASETTTTYTEKRVDVNIAVDMVAKAMKNEFDVAYLLSADGDFVPAVNAVREMDKKVFAATPGPGRELGKIVNAFIRLRREWFSDDVLLKSQTSNIKTMPAL